MQILPQKAACPHAQVGFVTDNEDCAAGTVPYQLLLQTIPLPCINPIKLFNFRQARSEREIASLFLVNPQTVHTIRKTYATEGLDAAIGRKKRQTPPIQPKITGDVEAKIIALRCGEPQEGRSKWTVRLLADKAVELQIIDSISHESVFRLLKK